MSASGGTIKATFTYDPDGNQTLGLGRTITYYDGLRDIIAAGGPAHRRALAPRLPGRCPICYERGIHKARRHGIHPDVGARDNVVERGMPNFILVHGAWHGVLSRPPRMSCAAGGQVVSRRHPLASASASTPEAKELELLPTRSRPHMAHAVTFAFFARG